MHPLSDLLSVSADWAVALVMYLSATGRVSREELQWAVSVSLLHPLSNLLSVSGQCEWVSDTLCPTC